MGNYELTPRALAEASKWLQRNWNPLDVEDCTACAFIEDDYCPPHAGYVRGWHERGVAITKHIQGDSDD